MKSPDDVKDAHDLLAKILMGHHIIHFTPKDLRMLQAQHDVCCWMNGCEGKDHFQNSLDGLKELLGKAHILEYGREFKSKVLVE